MLFTTIYIASHVQFRLSVIHMPFLSFLRFPLTRDQRCAMVHNLTELFRMNRTPPTEDSLGWLCTLGSISDDKAIKALSHLALGLMDYDANRRYIVHPKLTKTHQNY